MTQTSPDPARLWLKMARNDEPNAEAIWATRLIPGHHVVARGLEPGVFEQAECPETGQIGFWDPVEGVVATPKETSKCGL